MMPYAIRFKDGYFDEPDRRLRRFSINNPTRYIFRARVTQGVLLVPPEDSKEVICVD